MVDCVLVEVSESYPQNEFQKSVHLLHLKLELVLSHGLRDAFIHQGRPVVVQVFWKQVDFSFLVIQLRNGELGLVLKYLL